LTKTFNRRHFDTRFQKAFDQVKNRNACLSLAILDIDHFKRFNDLYGHEVGDKALATVAQTLNNALRETDSLFRYGGEEFTTLLPNTDKQDAILVAERMRSTVDQLEIKGQAITVSIGLTTFNGRNYASLQEMFSHTDNALYTAKAEGRNCTVHAGDIDAATLPEATQPQVPPPIKTQ
jgi:diguanylate cyclase (GGDEF)-like protein